MVAYTWDSSSWEVEAGGLVVQSQLQLHNKFETRPVSKKDKQKEQTNKQQKKLTIFNPFLVATHVMGEKNGSCS